MIEAIRHYPPAYVKRLAAWNDRFLTDPITVVLTELLAPLRWLSPSAVTLIAFGFSLIACFCFLDATRSGLISGALFWEINYLLDGVDGKLARKRSEFAPYGARLDNLLDKVKKALALAALVLVEKDHQAAMIVAVGCHYILLRVPSQRSMGIVEWFNRQGARTSLDPLDMVFLLLFVGPLLGNTYSMILFVLFLQVADRAVHVIACMRENHARKRSS